MTRRRNEAVFWDIFFRFEAEHRYKLLIKNLTYWTSESDVLKILEKIVKDAVHSIKILEDQTNGLSAGFCCVSFESQVSLDQVIHYFSDHKDDAGCEVGSSCAWTPVPICFSRYEFQKLLDEAQQHGRIRIQPDYDVSIEGSDENWSNSPEYQESSPNYSDAGSYPTQSYFQCRAPYQWHPPKFHYHHHRYQNFMPWSPPLPDYRASSSFRKPPLTFSYRDAPPFPSPMTEQGSAEKTDADLEITMESNKNIASRAIRKGTEARLNGCFREARQILRDAINEIENSKAPEDESYKTLLWTLKDMLSSVRDDYPNHQTIKMERRKDQERSERKELKSHKSRNKTSDDRIRVVPKRKERGSLTNDKGALSKKRQLESDDD